MRIFDTIIGSVVCPVLDAKYYISEKISELPGVNRLRDYLDTRRQEALERALYHPREIYTPVQKGAETDKAKSRKVWVEDILGFGYWKTIPKVTDQEIK